ncbi:MAG: coiled-coil [archaeon GW2011_AR5]|nr:MAG: coiled-coil [archaeon GW2011_AR5]
MDSEKAIRELIKQNLHNGVPLSQLRKFCIEHNFPTEIVDDALTESELEWRRSLSFSITMLSGWNAFEQALRNSQGALRDMKEWYLGKSAVLNLLIGIYLGIIGNIFASALMLGQWNLTLAISGILLVIVLVFYIHSFFKLRSKDKEYKNFFMECLKNVEESKKILEERARQFTATK